jgi:hypothetical protein
VAEIRVNPKSARQACAPPSSSEFLVLYHLVRRSRTRCTATWATCWNVSGYDLEQVHSIVEVRFATLLHAASYIFSNVDGSTKRGSRSEWINVKYSVTHLAHIYLQLMEVKRRVMSLGPSCLSCCDYQVFFCIRADDDASLVPVFVWFCQNGECRGRVMYRAVRRSARRERKGGEIKYNRILSVIWRGSASWCAYSGKLRAPETIFKSLIVGCSFLSYPSDASRGHRPP